ncbi:TPA: ABC transporter permease [Candidatus Woesearchaeota archaeon]|nr:ABC transporter permease [Candidatus Woesearchaeota archaeon]
MKTDYFKYAIDNLLHRKMRSWLTVLSILIGITAIFALVSFGQGLSSYVDTIGNEAGRDKLLFQSSTTANPGADDTFSLKKEEIDFLRKVNGIKEVAATYIKVAETEFDKQKKYVFTFGIKQNEEYKLVEEAFTLKLDKGRRLKHGDKFDVMLGYNYQLPSKIFKKVIGLRDKIKINGKDFEVVGFYKSIGNPQDDSNLYITDEAFEELYPALVDKFQFGIARSEKSVASKELAEFAEDKLRRFKGLDKGEEDFSIQTFQQAVETFTNILNVINAVLVLIALISLLVAGVNITNTMYTAVLERTKEIGVMKAVGAQNKDIMMIFLLESGMLGLIGGVLGVVCGYFIASIGGQIAVGYGYAILQPVFSWVLVVGCLGFAFFIGAIAGLLPARQASKLRPVDALRYE